MCVKLDSYGHAEDRSRLDNSSRKKRGTGIGYTGFRRTTGTKIHLAVNGAELPVSFQLGPANVHDSKMFRDVLDGIRDMCGRKIYVSYGNHVR